MPFVKTDPVEITVNDSENYALTITYGGAVMHGSSSFFNFENEFKTGTITDSPLGTGSAIKGKTLTVSSSMAADNPAATFVSIIYKINDQSFINRKKIDGDRLFVFETDIIFN